MERELKPRSPTEDLEMLHRAPLFSRPEGEVDASRLLTSTYFDTPELGFHRCKASLRVRVVGGQRVQTLKLEGTVQAGMFDRDEFEMPVDSDTPDLNLLQDQIWADTD